jgi:dephospho-CoA kinase
MILGLTGGIASGKSTVSNYLKSKNIPIVDCDAIGHKVLNKGSEGAKQIEKAFGKKFFKEGRLDRQLLATYCFENEERTALLNSIVHPLIFAEMEAQLESHKYKPIVVLDAPLLIEAGLHKRCDKVLLVICAEETRILRGIKRSNLSQMDMRNRINRQLKDHERKEYAHYVIDNGGALEKTFEQVDKILKELENV